VAENKLIQFKGTIYENGYGLIAKKVMKDPNLSLSAKAIYAYLCSYAGNESIAFPSVKLINHELGISKDTFYKYMKELNDKAYIVVSQKRAEKGKFSHNVYSIETVPCPKSPCTDSPDTDSPDTVFPDTTSNNTTNNNTTNNNSCSSSKELPNKDVYNHYEKCGFGLLNARLIEMIDVDLEMFGKVWTIDAMNEAVRQNRYKLAYVEGILRNWKANGRKPPKEEPVKNGRSRNNKRNTKESGSSGPSEETRRIEDLARQQGIDIDNLQDIECDY
jgi:DnaD/phage-associated family protein